MIRRLSLVLMSVLAAQNAYAFETMEQVSYAFNTLLFLFCGVLVMFMAAGFTMLEAGMVRHKSVAVILVKNIALYSVAGLMFYLIGYNAMYVGVDGGFMGTFSLWGADDLWIKICGCTTDPFLLVRAEFSEANARLSAIHTL